MPENDRANDDSGEADKKNDSTPHATVRAKPVRLRWFVIGGIVATVALIFVSIYLPHLTERVKFFTANFLSLVVLFVIVVQSYFSRKQWESMETQSRATQDQLKVTRDALELNKRAVIAAERSATVAENNAEEARRGWLMQRHDTSTQLKAMKEQAEAAKTSAQAAMMSAKAAERSLRYSQRAYVTVTKREGRFEGFRLIVENSGNTPALDVAVKTATGLDFMPPKLPEALDEKGRTYIGMLAPRDSYEILVDVPDRPLTEEESGWYENPKLGFNWWCVGEIFYRDIFQTNVADYRLTTFAFYQDRIGHNVQAWTSGNEVEEYYTADEKPKQESAE